ncbi:DeoR/GlpR family DNA-binding transcription regulator [Pseudobutyrivibrio sp.]|uniref:DeoR/GlpR family DNA-binding transcription regulator n=1 Tax=Pseudobutyrivibrio sp. TaxID=2014367 RepID=UPI001D41ECDD|nr:DeoR/GlpR family DNA-binding transcription regulator [Pseudobutyrivibrio sp.]MBE5909941.1 DeoR/GlpR transcriptional regulator [Pseudobutyrivibrio sp.]
MANGAIAFQNTQNRRRQILEDIKTDGFVKTSALSEKFNCSEVTIRTDIRELATAGLLKRTHGGAVAIDAVETPLLETKTISKFVAEKQRITKTAFEYINSGDTILLDDSSTSYYLSLCILAHPEKKIVVVTNGIASAYELTNAPHVELHVVGGYVGGQNSGHLAATLGDSAIETIQSFHVDKGFIGVHSINFDVGLTSIATPQMQIKRAIISSSKSLFVLADHTKFENSYLSVVCPISTDFTIITDSGIDSSIKENADSIGLNLLVV